MKKSTLIIIVVVYIASIALISFFGLMPVVYRPVYPVQKIEILNESDAERGTEVYYNNLGILTIKTKFVGPADENNPNKGTIVQLLWRITPDNATNKDVEFIYNKDLTESKLNYIKFVKDEKGRELGALLIFHEVRVELTIRAADGSGVNTKVVIWAY